MNKGDNVKQLCLETSSWSNWLDQKRRPSESTSASSRTAVNSRTKRLYHDPGLREIFAGVVVDRNASLALLGM